MPMIKKYFYLFLASFIVGLSVPSFLASNFLANAVNNPYSRSSSWEDSVVAYHVRANELTNQFLDQLFNSPDPDVSYPGGPEGCTRSNLSTFCLGVKLSDELFLLERDLLERMDDLDIESLDRFDEAVARNASRESDIQSNIDTARDTLELTLAVYNQAQVTYPIHEDFQTLIKALQKYRDALAKVRDTIELYPSKFNDAVTPECK